MTMLVKDYMIGKVYIVGPEEPLAAVRNLFLKRKVESVLVHDEKPLGIITERDLGKAFFEEKRPIDSVPAKDIMSSPIITVEPDASVYQAARIMAENSISTLPVYDGKEILGILPNTHLLRFFIEHHTGDAPMTEVMTPDVITLTENHSIFRALKLMKEHDIDRVVVVRDNRPVGILSDTDISFSGFGLKPKKMTFLRKTVKGVRHEHVKVFPLVVGDLMNTRLETVRPFDDASTGAKRMLDKRIGSVLVMEGDSLLGISTKTDYVKWLAQRRE